MGVFSGKRGSCKDSKLEGSYQYLAISGYFASNLSSSSLVRGSQLPSFRAVSTYFLAYFLSAGLWA